MFPVSGDHTQSIIAKLEHAPGGIRVVICDPDDRNRARLRLIFDSEHGFSVVADCRNWLECRQALDDLLPELLIAGHEGLGEEWLQTGNSGCGFPVVIMMGEREGGQWAARVVDHLQLPLEVAAIQRSAERARSEIFSRKAAELSYLLDRYAAHAPAPIKMSLHTDGPMHILDANPGQILYLKADKNYVCVHSDAGSYEIRETMNHLMNRLDARQFVRVHRSVIVNVSRIQDVAWVNDVPVAVVLEGGAKIRIGPNYRDRFRTFTLRESA